MAELLNQDKEMAASFLNSVLNQLNWAFSEFIGMIQEVREPPSAPLLPSLKKIYALSKTALSQWSLMKYYRCLRTWTAWNL